MAYLDPMSSQYPQGKCNQHSAAMIQKRNLYTIIFVTLALFFYVVSKHLVAQACVGMKCRLDESKPSFEEVARKHGTDKVTTHKYQFMYEKYLHKLQGKPIKLLEIGLGCNMDYGPGASYHTWLEYLPDVELYLIENDVECAEEYRHKTANAHIFIGDQADNKFLTQFAFDVTKDGPFDVIIDDGGHTMNQQITSLEALWKIVKPGGLYVIEDLQTSYLEDYNGDPKGKNMEKLTTMKYIYGLLDVMMAGQDTNSIAPEVQSIDCMAEICALRRKKAGE